MVTSCLIIDITHVSAMYAIDRQGNNHVGIYNLTATSLDGFTVCLQFSCRNLQPYWIFTVIPISLWLGACEFRRNLQGWTRGENKNQLLIFSPLLYWMISKPDWKHWNGCVKHAPKPYIVWELANFRVKMMSFQCRKPLLEITWSCNSVIFTMRFTILLRHIYIETGLLTFLSLTQLFIMVNNVSFDPHVVLEGEINWSYVCE